MPLAADIAIRLATTADRDAALALLVAQLREHAIQTPEDALGRALDRLLTRPGRGFLLLATRADRPIGLVALSFAWPLEHAHRSMWLEELYVEPTARGHGAGTALLDAAVARAADHGATTIDLEVDAGHRRAERLYARAGFAPLPRARWVRRLEPARPAPIRSPDALDGGCFCGAVRYHVAAAPRSVTHCHCRICRRTTGAPFVTWATVPAAAFTFTRGVPRELQSTAQAVRTFCGTCGTALTFRELAHPRSVDVTVGSLDDPDALVPGDHIWTVRQLAWLELEDDLPRHPEADPAERDDDSA